MCCHVNLSLEWREGKKTKSPEEKKTEMKRRVGRSKRKKMSSEKESVSKEETHATREGLEGERKEKRIRSE